MPEQQAPIELTTIEGSLVSEDGRFVKLNCHSREGEEVQIVIPTPALDNLVRNLQLIVMSANITMRTSDPIKVPVVQFMEPEPVFIVTALGGTSAPETGLVQLRVGQMAGPNFQLSIMKEQAEVLYQLLLDVFATADDKPS